MVMTLWDCKVFSAINNLTFLTVDFLHHITFRPLLIFVGRQYVTLNTTSMRRLVMILTQSILKRLLLLKVWKVRQVEESGGNPTNQNIQSIPILPPHAVPSTPLWAHTDDRKPLCEHRGEVKHHHSAASWGEAQMAHTSEHLAVLGNIERYYASEKRGRRSIKLAGTAQTLFLCGDSF